MLSLAASASSPLASARLSSVAASQVQSAPSSHVKFSSPGIFDGVAGQGKSIVAKAAMPIASCVFVRARENRRCTFLQPRDRETDAPLPIHHLFSFRDSRMSKSSLRGGPDSGATTEAARNMETGPE